MSSLIGNEQGKVIVEEYDKKSLFLMYLKCYYHLHPLVETERGVVAKGRRGEKFGYLWHDSQHKWTNNGIGQQRAFDFQALSSGC